MDARGDRRTSVSIGPASIAPRLRDPGGPRRLSLRLSVQPRLRSGPSGSLLPVTLVLALIVVTVVGVWRSELGPAARATLPGGPGPGSGRAAGAVVPSGVPQVVKIGVDLPLSGGEAPNGIPTLNGIKLALAQISVPGYEVELVIEDDAVNGVHDPQQGARNMTDLVNDPSVFAVVGPFNSNVAKAEIPISNAAGLMQCSPSNTNPALTKPWVGSSPADLRPVNPDLISYVRVSTTDDWQGAAAARLAFSSLKAHTAYVVDDGETYGRGIADSFIRAFKSLGGRVVARNHAGLQVKDYTKLLLAAKATHPQFVYFGGVTATGGGLLRKQMVTVGMGGVPFGGPDGISDGSASVRGSFLSIAGPKGDRNTYMTVAATHDIPNRDALANAYRTAFGSTPGDYTAAAYACTQVFLDALAAVGPDRAAVRAYVADTSHTYDTVIGPVGFDRNGDTTHPIVSEYRFDPATRDWAFLRQVALGSR